MTQNLGPTCVVGAEPMNLRVGESDLALELLVQGLGPTYVVGVWFMSPRSGGSCGTWVSWSMSLGLPIR